MGAVPDPVGSTSARQKLRFWLQLLKASRHVENELRDRLRQQFATTLPRFDVMAMLEKSGGGLRMSTLSAQLMVSNGNVTGIIERLVKDGLVERVPIKGDRRATLVRLTPLGKADFTKMARTHRQWIDELFAPLNEFELENAMKTLGKIRKLGA